MKVEDKSNEITVIPDLLDLLEIEEAIITIDAIGMQEEIANKIVEKKAHEEREYFLTYNISK